MQSSHQAPRPAQDLLNSFVRTLESWDFKGPQTWPITELRAAQNDFAKGILAAYGPLVSENPKGYYMSRIEFCQKLIFWEAVRRTLEKAMIWSKTEDEAVRIAADELRMRVRCVVPMMKTYEAGARLTMSLYSEPAEALLALSTAWQFQHVQPPFVEIIAEVGWLVDEMWFIVGNLRGQLLRDVRQTYDDVYWHGKAEEGQHER